MVLRPVAQRGAAQVEGILLITFKLAALLCIQAAELDNLQRAIESNRKSRRRETTAVWVSTAPAWGEHRERMVWGKVRGLSARGLRPGA